MEAEVDTECYRNFWLFRALDQHGKFHTFPMTNEMPLDRQGVADFLYQHKIYTFNGINYDMPMITLALNGATCAQLKEANDAIITKGLKPWDFYNYYNIQPLDYLNHVDLIEVAPGVRISLKLYAGRNHSLKMQDLPYPHDKELSPWEMFNTTDYCGNDLWNTKDLRVALAGEIALRDALTYKYQVDLRSKSDAQIAEAIIKTKLTFKPQRRYIPHGYNFYCDIPPHIKFATPELQEVLSIVRNASFVVEDKEQAIELGILEGVRTGVKIPDELKKMVIKIGNGKYKFGIGGLHSQEQTVSYYTNDYVEYEDIDVDSFYPTSILNANMYPEQIGPGFIPIYREIYDRRLFCKSEAKRLEKIAAYLDGQDKNDTIHQQAQMTVENEGLKIVLNGTFGKLFSMWSVVYAPELGIKVTIGNQLSLLMLIEMLELSGIRVVSANTDGLVVEIKKGMRKIFEDVVRWWEQVGGFTMSSKKYRSIHFRDVNNYVAIDSDGKAKRKGVFGQGGITKKKHPEKEICSDAVVEYLLNGTSIRETIKKCNDIRKFVVIRQAKGGACYSKTGEYLGKAIRWYYGMEPWFIATVGSGNRVAGSEYAVPCMQLPPIMPTDVNHEYYIREAMEMLKDIGVVYGRD